MRFTILASSVIATTFKVRKSSFRWLAHLGEIFIALVYVILVMLLLVLPRQNSHSYMRSSDSVMECKNVTNLILS